MFANRVDAAEKLANVLKGLFLPHNLLVMGIARGGVVTADIIARRLHVPLGALIVKKISAPVNAELAIGAYGEKDIVYWDKALIERVGVTTPVQRMLAQKVGEDVKERQKLYASWYKRPVVKGKNVLVVDDGIATGATVICASEVVKAYGADTVFVVTPVIPEQIVSEVRSYVMEIISLETPRDFVSVGSFYQSFPQLDDEDIKRILQSNIHHSNRLQM